MEPDFEQFLNEANALDLKGESDVRLSDYLSECIEVYMKIVSVNVVYHYTNPRELENTQMERLTYLNRFMDVAKRLNTELLTRCIAKV